MEIKFNHDAANNYELFGIDEERSDVILDHIAIVCSNAYEQFPDKYSTTETTIGNQTMLLGTRLDVAQVLEEMIAIAETDQEKFYIIFTAPIGIDRVQQLLTNSYNKP